jgi:hypothetical protein
VIFFPFRQDPLVIVIFRNGHVKALGSSTVHRAGKKRKAFLPKTRPERPQVVVEDSNLTATSAFPALAILRP